MTSGCSCEKVTRFWGGGDVFWVGGDPSDVAMSTTVFACSLGV
jgi:hypothetical protein